MTDTRTWLVLALLSGGGLLLYLLAPVLTPFLVAALLAYIGDPLVDRLEAQKLSRSLSVTIVFLGLSFIALLLLAILVPLVGEQIRVFATRLPTYIDWIQTTVMPFLQSQFGLERVPDVSDLKAAIQENWQQAGGVLVNMLGSVTHSGGALLVVLANLVLIPVVTFYMLRDWDIMLARLHDLLPRSIEQVVGKLAKESDEVLGAFMRGQLVVMLALGAIYSIGLWIAGLEYALLIGLIAGMVSFVPYLGVIVGVALAVIAGLFQFPNMTDLWPIAVVFGVGQLIESFVLTPLLVGDKIGLHPVAVIFAIAAFGQLFGFFGILLALPAAAVIVVLVRHVHEQYRGSSMYAAQEAVDIDAGDGC